MFRMFGTTSFELPEHCKQVMAEISEFFVSSQYKDLKLLLKGNLELKKHQGTTTFL